MLFTKYFAFVVAFTLFSASAYAEQNGSDVAQKAPIGAIDPHLPHIAYVNFQSLDANQPLTVSGQLRVPRVKSQHKVPAVVVVHGSGGVDSRGRFYIEVLNDAGIATLEIDMWAARGLSGGVNGRPKGVPETLPDAYGALEFLAKDERIDPDRVGVMGFSWGGVVSMLTATEPYTSKYLHGNRKFAAHVAHYPICWGYNRLPTYEFNSFTKSPVLIQAGELDTYDHPDSCSKLVQSLPEADQAFISVQMYKSATHAWDRLQPSLTVYDPYAYLGKGGEVEIKPNPAVAFQSRANALSFFQKAFGMTH